MITFFLLLVSSIQITLPNKHITFDRTKRNTLKLEKRESGVAEKLIEQFCSYKLETPTGLYGSFEFDIDS